MTTPYPGDPGGSPHPKTAFTALAGVRDRHFAEPFRHGSLVVEIYRPRGEDRQTPHTRDEVYVVISGSGYFVDAAESRPFESGEVLFVPAHAVHRFEDFSADFSTWVFFYGPEGGEAAYPE